MSVDVLTRGPCGQHGSTQCVKGDPQHLFEPFTAFEETTHVGLTVQDSTSYLVRVNIFTGYNATSDPFELNSTDTIGKLKQKFLESGKKKFGGDLDLAYNGKPVKDHQTLAELQVKNGATFLHLHRCIGG